MTFIRSYPVAVKMVSFGSPCFSMYAFSNASRALPGEAKPAFENTTPSATAPRPKVVGESMPSLPSTGASIPAARSCLMNAGKSGS